MQSGECGIPFETPGYIQKERKSHDIRNWISSKVKEKIETGRIKSKLSLFPVNVQDISTITAHINEFKPVFVHGNCKMVP